MSATETRPATVLPIPMPGAPAIPYAETASTSPASGGTNPIPYSPAIPTSEPILSTPANLKSNPTQGAPAEVEVAVPPSSLPSPNASAAGGYLELRVLGEMLSDVMETRKACRNRAERGGVDPTLYIDQLQGLDETERKLRLALRRAFRRVAPRIRAWAMSTVGVDEAGMARLLGMIGDPRVAQPYHWEGEGPARTLVPNVPYARSISQLWSYCGHGDPQRKRRKGMTAEEAFGLGNPAAKSMVWNLATAAMKQTGSAPAIREAEPSLSSPGGGEESDDDATNGSSPKSNAPRRRSPYRDVYDARRLATADRVHATPCAQCGTKGKPAAPGTPWRPGHQHADALRIVGKEILRDLWLAAGGDPSAKHVPPPIPAPRTGEDA